jgi:hypothetical protein
LVGWSFVLKTLYHWAFKIGVMEKVGEIFSDEQFSCCRQSAFQAWSLSKTRQAYCQEQAPYMWHQFQLSTKQLPGS